MDTLFDLDALPTKDTTPAQSKPVHRFYLRGKRLDGNTYILWKTHDGDAEYFLEGDEKGRKPRFWNTLQAAEKARKEYGGSVEVWKDES